MRLSTPNPFQWARNQIAYLFQGRRVKREVLRAAAELVVQNAAADVGRVTERLANGAASLGEWEREMQDALKRLHMAQTALARGGWQQMAPANWRAAEKALRFHYPYLRGFAQDIASGRVPLQSPQLLSRAQQYVMAGRATYENERLALHTERGFAEAKRVLAATHHCGVCEEWAAKGWMPINEMLPIGDAQCRVNCNCVIVYR